MLPNIFYYCWNFSLYYYWIKREKIWQKLCFIIAISSSKSFGLLQKNFTVFLCIFYLNLLEMLCSIKGWFSSSGFNWKSRNGCHNFCNYYTIITGIHFLGLLMTMKLSTYPKLLLTMWKVYVWNFILDHYFPIKINSIGFYRFIIFVYTKIFITASGFCGVPVEINIVTGFCVVVLSFLVYLLIIYASMCWSKK